VKSLYRRWSLLLSKTIAYGLVVTTVIGLIAQLDSGLADNGDFTRAMTVFSSGPTDIHPNWPDPINQKEMWERRFFKFYIPYWKLDYPEPFSINRPFKSTAYLLWLPGVFLNRMFWSTNALNIGMMSLPTRLFLIIFVWLVIKWIRSSLIAEKTIILLLCFVGPIVVLILSPYSRYLNSFYYESAALFFVPLFFCVIVILTVRSFAPIILCLVVFTTSILIAMAKAQWFYWPFIAALGALIVLRKRSFSISWSTHIGILIVAIFLSVAALVFTRPSTEALSVNAYHRFFYGALMLSRDSQSHLAHLGVPELSECIGVHGYTEQGLACRRRAKEVVKLVNLVKVLLHEPALIVRMLNAAAQNMHVIALPYLGTFSEHDPRGRTGYQPGLIESVWLTMKKALPRGPLVFLWLMINWFISWRAIRKSKSDLIIAIGIIGVLAAITAFLDMMVAVLGEGLYELQKHLFMANLMFDISTICSCNIILLYLLNKATPERKG